jgi:hypothetical protein
VGKVLRLCTAAAAMLLVAVNGHRAGPSRVLTAVPIRAVVRSYGGTGGLVGAIVFRGRVPRGASKHRYHRGWVEVGQQGHLVAKQWVKAGHRYHFALSPGPYDIAGYTRWGTCRGTVQVPPDRTIRRNVYCVFH